MSEPLSEAFQQIAELAESLGVIPLNAHAGCWMHDVGKWRIKVNAHREEIDGVPPFYALVTWSGLPALLVNPFGGTTMGGGDPEGDFIRDMRAEIDRLKAKR